MTIIAVGSTRALQRTRHGVAVGNSRVPWAGSLSLGRSAQAGREWNLGCHLEVNGEIA